MLRVCGADGERHPAAQRLCWCGGFFCGRGGDKQSLAFRRVFHTTKVAESPAEFRDLVSQCDLFDGDQAREEWLARVTRGERNATTAKRQTARAQDNAGPGRNAR